jgi:CspA family cold shock protein
MTTTFRDTHINCRECGKQFILTVEKQRKAAELGDRLPETCESCTQRVRYHGKLHGRVKWFSLEKGYGFITDDAGKDVFLHRDGLLVETDQPLPTLQEGQQVLYGVMETSRGPQAIQVELFQG